MLKFIFVLFSVLFVSRYSFSYEMGEEQILLSSNEQQKHLAFPHAISDKKGHLWLVYRAAENHVGSLGTIWLAKYNLSDLKLLGHWPIYTHKIVDPRDPILHLEGDDLYISFFQYNYVFRLVRQFVLKGSIRAGHNWSQTTPVMLDDKSIENHSSCAPMLNLRKNLILPIYYVNGFYSNTTSVGYFSIDKKFKVNRRVEIQKSSDRYLLEPTIIIDPNNSKHWISLFRTSPREEGVGSIGPMMKSESVDGGRTWSVATDSEFKGQHPKFTIDGKKRIWAGFRDLSNYDEKNYHAQITLWNMSENKRLALFETTKPDKQNWDCGYPSLIELTPGNFRAVYYYARDGKFYLATRTFKE